MTREISETIQRLITDPSFIPPPEQYMGVAHVSYQLMAGPLPGRFPTARVSPAESLYGFVLDALYLESQLRTAR
jgi:hypothetical protein